MENLLDRYKETLTKVSIQIYEDLDRKSDITRLSCENLSLALCFRSEIFGENVSAASEYIVTTLNDLDQLSCKMPDLLTIAHCFDHAPGKDKKHEERLRLYESRHDRLQEINGAARVLGVTLQIPEAFETSVKEDAPAKKFRENIKDIYAKAVEAGQSLAIRYPDATKLIMASQAFYEAVPELQTEFEQSVAYFTILESEFSFMAGFIQRLADSPFNLSSPAFRPL
jgi:hypothetical protein